MVSEINFLNYKNNLVCPSGDGSGYPFTASYTYRNEYNMELGDGSHIIFVDLERFRKSQIVQMNWKPSEFWETSPEDIKKYKKVIESLKNAEEKYELFMNREGNSVFFNELKFSGYNLLKDLFQEECDLMGVQISSAQQPKYYTVDVAYHKKGLDYGGNKENVNRVIWKLLKTAISLKYFMRINEADLYFASPKIHPLSDNGIRKGICYLNNHLNNLLNEEFQEEHRFNFHLISNEKFYLDVIGPLRKHSDDINDTSELFLRSLQLLEMFQLCSIKSDHLQKINKIFKNRIIGKDDLSNLMNADYCAEHFHIPNSLIKGEKSKDYIKLDVKPAKYIYNKWLEEGYKKLLCWIEEKSPTT